MESFNSRSAGRQSEGPINLEEVFWLEKASQRRGTFRNSPLNIYSAK